VASAGPCTNHCISLLTDNYTNISLLVFLQAGCSCWHPLNSVKIWRHIVWPISEHTNHNGNEGDGGGGHWLVRMEWRPAGWSVCLRLLIFPYAIKFRSFSYGTGSPGWVPEKGRQMAVWKRKVVEQYRDLYISPLMSGCDVCYSKEGSHWVSMSLDAWRADPTVSFSTFTSHTHTHTPFYGPLRDHPGKPVPEEIFWTLWCKGG